VVDGGNLVKGYEFEKDRFVLLDDADFDSARIDSSSTISIETFVPNASINRSIMTPATSWVRRRCRPGRLRRAAGGDVQSKRTALSRVVIARRERVLAITPTSGGLWRIRCTSGRPL